MTDTLILIAAILFLLFPILIYKYTRRSIVRRFIAAGAVIPILLMVAKEAELFFNLKEVPLASLYGVYLWPSSFLLMGSHGNEWGAWLFLLITISLNALLYALLGYLVDFTRQLKERF